MNSTLADIKKSKEELLIVDDTIENLQLLSALLAKEGYNVRKALNGRMALTTVEASPPDLILLDIMMPELDGYEVCRQLKSREHTAKIPIIFLSAIDDGFNKAKAFASGGVDYITKPFQFKEVLARIRNQLSLRAAEIKNEQLNAELENRVKERTLQLEAAQTQLLQMTLHDALTELPNRKLLMERLGQALNCLKENFGHPFSVLVLDCDRFKVINDSLGHPVGDELLIAIAHRLKTILQPEDILARLGGDEFAILVSEVESYDRAIQLANQILNVLAQPFQLQKHEVFINASIGIALGHSNYEKPEHLLRDADTAMYHAKSSGRACYQVFNPVMHEAVLQRLQLETDLRKAIQQGELTVYYQPIIALNTGKVSGLEALVRWNHPRLGLISPSTFVPLAEETGFIVQIDRWVIRQACQQLRQWQQENLLEHSLTISVNLSVQQLTQPDLIEHIEQLLAETQLEPQYLRLEITESAIIDNIEGAAAIFQQLKTRQIQVSIDDFGIGYSSLSYLHSFPVNTLKIDRSFVQRINGNGENPGLVLLIINIARAMGLTVIAEGIETPQQLVQLRALNCDFSQGYLFSEPLEPKEVINLITLNPQW